MDVGIAGICAMSKKPDPTLVTYSDLEECAKEMEERYTRAFSRYLHAVFFNAGYHNGGEQTRKRYLENILYAFRRTDGSPSERCFFSKGPAHALIDRSNFPLLAPSGCVSYGPKRGIPINGAYLTAAQTLALSTAFVGGRASWVHVENPDLLIEVTKARIATGRKVAAGAALDKGSQAYVKDTSVVREMQSVVELMAGNEPSPVTFYLGGNSRDPSVEKFHYPTTLIRFLLMLPRDAELKRAWKTLTHTFDFALKDGRRSNLLWNRLNRVARGEFLVPEAVARLIGLVTSASIPEIAHEKWILSVHFLTEVYGMKAKKIEIARQIADRMAELVSGSQKKGFFQDFRGAVTPDKFLALLTRVHTEQVKEGKKPPFSFDDAVELLGGEDRGELFLIRRLFMIRLVDQLYAKNYFESAEAKQELEGLADESETATEEKAIVEEV
jgi:hypothetical protein